MAMTNKTTTTTHEAFVDLFADEYRRFADEYRRLFQGLADLFIRAATNPTSLVPSLEEAIRFASLYLIAFFIFLLFLGLMAAPAQEGPRLRACPGCHGDDAEDCSTCGGVGLVKPVPEDGEVREE